MSYSRFWIVLFALLVACAPVPPVPTLTAFPSATSTLEGRMVTAWRLPLGVMEMAAVNTPPSTVASTRPLAR